MKALGDSLIQSPALINDGIAERTTPLLYPANKLLSDRKILCGQTKNRKLRQNLSSFHNTPDPMLL